MFVALRDLAHARGRFALVSTVIVLISLLVTLLASLTAGLTRESTSAITGLPADRLAFSMPATGDSPEFTASRVTTSQWQGWDRAPGVSAEPLGITTTRAESEATTAAVTAFGVPAGSGSVPDGELGPGQLVLSEGAADALDAEPGDELTLAGTEFDVTATTTVDSSYSHTPVVWLDLAAWQGLISDRGSAPAATVVALSTDDVSESALADTDAELGTTTVTTGEARSAVASYVGENTSLSLMQISLVAISALVVGAFFSVWTVGRSGDLAVLKALGASTGYLLRDAVGQSALVLVAGIALGTGLTVAAGAALPDGVPLAVTPATTLLPAGALGVLGLVGASVAIIRITRIDPHAALAAR